MPAEKILEEEEALRPSWPVAGTTGYDFLNRLGGLFVDPAGSGPLRDDVLTGAEVSGGRVPVSDLVTQFPVALLERVAR